MKDRINLGCGKLVYPDHWNVDMYEAEYIDEVWDLDKHPWPWADEQFNGALALDIYEHVDDPVGFVNDLWRILKEGSKVRLRTTYWNTKQSFQDPTHKRWLTEKSFDYWVPGTTWHNKYGEGYSGGRHFELVRVYLDGSELEWNLIRGDRCEGSCWPM